MLSPSALSGPQGQAPRRGNISLQRPRSLLRGSSSHGGYYNLATGNPVLSFYPPSQKTMDVSPWMNAQGGPSEARRAKEGASADCAEEMKDTSGVSPWRLHSRSGSELSFEMDVGGIPLISEYLFLKLCMGTVAVSIGCPTGNPWAYALQVVASQRHRHKALCGRRPGYFRSCFPWCGSV